MQKPGYVNPMADTTIEFRSYPVPTAVTSRSILSISNCQNQRAYLQHIPLQLRLSTSPKD